MSSNFAIAPSSTRTESPDNKPIVVNALSSDSLLKFMVYVTYMTQGGTKKTDSIAILASTPAEAEREAEAQFKEKNPRSTFIRAEAEFIRTEAPDRRNRSIIVNAPPPDRPLKFTVYVTYMTQGGTKKTDSIAILASTPGEAERVAEAQFKGKNPRSTFIRAEAEFN
jgi:predicted ATPase